MSYPGCDRRSSPALGPTLVLPVARTFLALFAIIAVVLGSAACSRRSSKDEPPARPRHDIIDRKFTQAAHELSWYQFSIPASAADAKISGTFNVFGGSNDIVMIVTDEAGLNNFKNGMPYQAFYDSGRVTTGTLNFNLSPGTYYLIVSNRDTFVDPKTVYAKIYAEY